MTLSEIIQELDAIALELNEVTEGPWAIDENDDDNEELAQ